MRNIADSVFEIFKDREWGQQIVRKASEFAGGAYDYAELAVMVAENLEDRDWAKDLLTKAEAFAEESEELMDVASNIDKILGNKNWACKIYSKALDATDDPDEIEQIKEEMSSLGCQANDDGEQSEIIPDDIIETNLCVIDFYISFYDAEDDLDIDENLSAAEKEKILLDHLISLTKKNSEIFSNSSIAKASNTLKTFYSTTEFYLSKALSVAEYKYDNLISFDNIQLFSQNDNREYYTSFIVTIDNSTELIDLSDELEEMSGDFGGLIIAQFIDKKQSLLYGQGWDNGDLDTGYLCALTQGDDEEEYITKIQADKLSIFLGFFEKE